MVEKSGKSTLKENNRKVKLREKQVAPENKQRNFLKKKVKVQQ